MGNLSPGKTCEDVRPESLLGPEGTWTTCQDEFLPTAQTKDVFRELREGEWKGHLPGSGGY